MARALGCRVELQVRFDGIGYVDLLIDGWLVIECDSEQFHGGWEKQKSDRARDLALAARGYTTIRPTAEAIIYRPGEVVSALQGLLEAHRRRRSTPARVVRAVS